MSNEEFDMFEPDDSGDFEEYTGIVKTSVFDINEKYDEETLLLQWELEITTEDMPFDTRQISFSCGKKFESPDGGKTAVHESGKPKGFNSNSRMGMLVHRAFHDPDSDKPGPHLAGDKNQDEIESFQLRQWFIDNDFTPFTAEAWIGFEFRFHIETRDWGGEIGVRPFEMPIEVIALPGESGKKSSAKKTTTKKAAPKAEPKEESKPQTRKRASKKVEVEEVEALDVEKTKDAILDLAENTGFDTHAEFLAIAAGYLHDNGVDEDTPGAEEILEWMDDEDAINEAFE